MLALKVDNEHLKVAECIFRFARPEDAHELVESYESVFGRGGIRAPGHDPYPAPEVFSEEGILAIIADPTRDFIVAEHGGEVAGGMIITHNSPFHREFGCVSIRKNFQGKGFSSQMLAHQKKIEQQSSLVINTTEIVTHSMLSQAAHHKAGYDKIVGFGYCQYPNVFFAHAPESCLWITSIEGKILDCLRKSRPSGHRFRVDLPSLNTDEKILLSILEQPRTCYVARRYFDVASKVLSQFDDALSYRLLDATQEIASPPEADLQVDSCGDEPYAYLYVPERTIDRLSFEKVWRSIVASGKRYVQARLKFNHPSTIANTEFLYDQGFVFLGIAPVFEFDDKLRIFKDIFIMQWVKSEVLANCPLPGATDAVVKLFGYPLNLTKEIIGSIRADLKAGLT